jgi:acyl carrier protein
LYLPLRQGPEWICPNSRCGRRLDYGWAELLPSFGEVGEQSSRGTESAMSLLISVSIQKSRSKTVAGTVSRFHAWANDTPHLLSEPQKMSGSVEHASPKTHGLPARVVNAIYSALSELNLQLPEGGQVEQSLSTVLFGAGGRLDSLALANLIVIAEQKLDESFGFHIDLTQDDPFSPETGHFRTVQSLAHYISRFVEQKSDEVQH